MKVKETSLVKDILETYPEAFEVFIGNGFKYSSVDELINAVGDATMLKTILNVRGINPDLFIFHLEEKILKEEDEKEFLLKDYSPSEELDFYGNTICPLKFTFKDALEDIVKRNHKNGEELKCYIESGREANSVCEEVFNNTGIEKFPNILFSKEFNEYLHKGFQDDMTGKGYFKDYKYENPTKEIVDAGILDPKGEYTVYSVMADVLLIDEKRLGDLPVPKTMEDLLNPIYKDNIIIFGKKKKEFSNAVFLYINKEYGEEGLKKFSHNIKSALHGAQMSKVAGTSSSEAAAIYIVSWFFAKTCTKENVKIHWPIDGAMTLPMYMMVKNNEKKGVQDIVDYVTGEEFGKICVKANTPTTNGNVDNGLPEGATFKWLGWDYIRQNDIASVARNNEKVFMKYWSEYHPNMEIFK